MKKEVEMDEELTKVLLDGMVNMRTYFLKQKPYIKKYYHYRKIHGEILDSMIQYSDDKIDNFVMQLNALSDKLIKEVNGNIEVLKIDLDLEKESDFHLFLELQLYKNHPNIKSNTEEYIEKNKFRNPEKIKMLNAMNNSFISFFKIIKKDFDGYVDIIDLVTGKKYQIIDISLSNPIYNLSHYIYARLFTVDNISFTSSYFAFPTNIKKVNNYIKKLKNKNKSNLIKTLETYYLYKSYGVEYQKVNIK